MIKDYFTKQAFKNGFTILKGAAAGFSDDRAMKFSASLAYYTIFSLAPLLLLIISLAGLFLGRDAAQGQIFHELNGLIGNDAAKQVQDMIKNLDKSGSTTISVIIGFITLIIGATTIFGEIQDSINIIWKVKAKPKRGWVKMLKDRLLSSSLIVTIGFLLMVSLVVNGALLALSDKLKTFLPDVTVTFFSILNLVISFIVITILFGVIFKVLPDVKIKWKQVRAGAFFTACLFMLGRFVIGIYIEKTSSGSAYGAAGSLIVILLWIYYTAAIMYFGAEFTQAYAEFKGAKIAPADYAVHVEQKETEKDVAVLPDQHKDELKKE
jgi:membrane protein